MPCACDSKTCSNAGVRCACDVTSRRRVAAPTETCMPAYPQSAPRQRRHTHTRRLRMSNLLETLPRRSPSAAVRHHGTSRRAGSTLRCCTRRHPQQQHVFVWVCVSVSVTCYSFPQHAQTMQTPTGARKAKKSPGKLRRVETQSPYSVLHHPTVLQERPWLGSNELASGLSQQCHVTL